jgi:hypothetical protein
MSVVAWLPVNHREARPGSVQLGPRHAAMASFGS